MTLEEIKAAVTAGQIVHWVNSSYVVVVDQHERWFVKCTPNKHYIGLTHVDGVTMNGRPEQFYIAGQEEAPR